MERQFQFTRVWRYKGYEGGIEDSLIFVDGEQIGGAYFCADETWASWGPATMSFGHPTREAAEAIQLRQYATNPDLYDRLNAVHRAELAAEQAQREAEQQTRIAELEAADRRRRLGDDEPGPTVWTLPAYHVLYAPLAEVAAVSAWFAANGLDEASSVHEVRVEQRVTRRAVVFEEPTPEASLIHALGQGRVKSTRTRVVTLSTEPPEIHTPARLDLHELLEEHWPSRFPLIDFGQRMACGTCTRSVGATVADQMVLWPCPEVAGAISGETMKGAA